MKKSKPKKRPQVAPESLWRKIGKMEADIQNLYEVHVLFSDRPERREIPDECISDSDEFFVSNDLYVVDNEAYAKEHWGKGNYFRVVRNSATECIKEPAKNHHTDGAISKPSSSDGVHENG